MRKHKYIDNPVEKFLKEYKSHDVYNDTIYSIKTLSKKLGLRKRQIYFYCIISPNISKCNPIDVGSGKKNLNIFKYNE